MDQEMVSAVSAPYSQQSGLRPDCKDLGCSCRLMEVEQIMDGITETHDASSGKPKANQTPANSTAKVDNGPKHIEKKQLHFRLTAYIMNNQKVARECAKRRRVNSSSAVQNQPLSHKNAQILDDIWFEALKYLTCPQWSLMSLVSRQLNGVIQRSLSRLPPPVINSATVQWVNFSFEPQFYPQFENVKFSMPRSLQLLFHPIVYFKEVKISAAHQKLSDVMSNRGRYIRCHSFILNTSGDTPGKRPSITDMSTSLKWLEKNVRSDTISFPEWVSYRVHATVRARAMLSNFIFGASQKCKVQELIFARCSLLHEHRVKFLNNLREDFMALPIIQGTIPTVVIYYYPQQEQYRAHFGENLIDREVDSQGAHALYEIENGEKRIRISFCYWNGDHKANLKFYTI